MKPFNLTWSNYNRKVMWPLPPPKIIGVSYEKSLIIGIFGTHHCLTIWMWKWFRVFCWISK